METQNGFDFNKITEAIAFYRLPGHGLFTEQADKLRLNNDQRRALLMEWAAGCRPEQLVAYLKPSCIKQQMEKTIKAMQSAKDWFPNVIIEVMTAEEYKGSAGTLEINYSFSSSRFGIIMVASTSKGVCYLGFADEGEEAAFKELKRRFPYANYTNREDEHQQNAYSIFDHPEGNSEPVRLHLKGTSFQISIWNKLLQIPFGGLLAYASLTGAIKNARAVGTAVGNNPVGYLIPCHQTVRTSGEFGPYYWRPARKAALISWEAARTNVLKRTGSEDPEYSTSQESGF